MTNAILRACATLVVVCLGHVQALAQPWTFVSIPDFNNQDIGSIAALPTFDGGFESTTASYEDAMDFIGTSIAQENPVFVAVAGDLVMGHWDRDVDGRQIFGPVGNLDQKRSAVEAAGAHYYPIWLRRFTDFGITNVVPALGDHEIGDNNWNPGGDRARLVGDYKRVFVEELLLDRGGNHRFALRPFGTPHEDTAFAFRHRDVLFVTVDVFRIDDPGTRLDSRTGAVLATVDGGQLQWLDGLLADARQPDAGAIRGVWWIIVQGHVPVLRSVRTRTSSRVFLRDFDGAVNESDADTGSDTEFWKTLVRHRVDLYLCGEVHDVTLSESGGVTQVVHGAITGQNSPINYLVVDVQEDRLELRVKEISPEFAYDSAQSGYGMNPLWQTGSNRPPSFYAIPQSEKDEGFVVVGSATLDASAGASELVSATGKLRPVVPLEPGSGLLIHLPFDGDTGNLGGSGSSNDGVLEGDARLTANGLLGGGVELGGAGRVRASDLLELEDIPRTLTVWVKSSAPGGLRTAATLGGNVAGGKFDVDLDLGNGGVLELGVGFGRTTGRGPDLGDGQWHLLGVVVPDNAAGLRDVRLFANGEFLYAQDNATQVVGTRPGFVTIGHGANADYFQPFIGAIDDYALWLDALSDDMMRAIYEVAMERALAYDAAQVQQLLGVFRAGEGGLRIGDVRWRFAYGLGDEPGLRPGERGEWILVLHAASGTGLVGIEESARDDLGSIDHRSVVGR